MSYKYYRWVKDVWTRLRWWGGQVGGQNNFKQMRAILSAMVMCSRNHVVKE